MSNQYLKFIGASPEPGKLLKKLDQNFSREKSQIFHILKVFGVTFLQKGNKKDFLIDNRITLCFPVYFLEHQQKESGFGAKPHQNKEKNKEKKSIAHFLQKRVCKK